MTMVYRTTLAPLFTLRREMDRLFDDAFGNRVATAPSAWSPAVDIREEPEAWTFEMDLPGIAPEAVEVTAEKGRLTISGEKRSQRETGGEEKWHLLERVHGTFKRSFALPENVAEDRIEAAFSNGVLTVRLPKAEAARPRKVEVRIG
jgi:HSP20 family protein